MLHIKGTTLQEESLPNGSLHTLISSLSESRVMFSPSGMMLLPLSVISKMFFAMKGLFLKGMLSRANCIAS